MKKEHMEILLEDIHSKFELVLEGHAALRSELHDFRRESNEKHEQTAFLLKTLNGKIDAVASDLSAHRTDTEIHSGYKVQK